MKSPYSTELILPFTHEKRGLIQAPLFMDWRIIWTDIQPSQVLIFSTIFTVEIP